MPNLMKNLAYGLFIVFVLPLVCGLLLGFFALLLLLVLHHLADTARTFHQQPLYVQMEQSTQTPPAVYPNTQPYAPAPHIPAEPSKGTNWLFIGLGLLAFIFFLAFIIRALTRTGARSSMPSPASQPQTQQVYATPPANANSNVVAYVNAATANNEVLEVQRVYNQTCLSNSNQLKEDGVIGEKTLAAIGRDGASDKSKEMARTIRTTGYVTREQIDWLKKPCGGTSSSPAPALTSDGEIKSTKTVDDVKEADIRNMSKSALQEYIKRKLNWSVAPASYWWAESDLRLWAVALYKGKKEFVLDGAHVHDKGTYETSSGKKATWS